MAPVSRSNGSRLSECRPQASINLQKRRCIDKLIQWRADIGAPKPINLCLALIGDSRVTPTAFPTVLPFPRSHKRHIHVRYRNSGVNEASCKRGRVGVRIAAHPRTDKADCGVSVSALVTSASVHDSQAAIPLAKMTAGRVTGCYDLMDAAYDAKKVREASKGLGHVPIIDVNPRRDR